MPLCTSYKNIITEHFIQQSRNVNLKQPQDKRNQLTLNYVINCWQAFSLPQVRFVRI